MNTWFLLYAILQLHLIVMTVSIQEHFHFLISIRDVCFHMHAYTITVVVLIYLSFLGLGGKCLATSISVAFSCCVVVVVSFLRQCVCLGMD